MTRDDERNPGAAYGEAPPFRPAKQEPLLTGRSRSRRRCRATVSEAPGAI